MSTKVSKFGYDKIVGATDKLLDGQKKLRKAFGDGLQLTDGFTVLAVYEDIAPMFRDGKALANQLRDLDEVEARKVYEEVAKLRGENPDTVEKAVIGSLDLLSDVYDFGKYLARRAGTIAAKAKAVFEDIF
jgi:hypothetical protein